MYSLEHGETKPTLDCRASTLLAALLAVTALSFIAAQTFVILGSRYLYGMQSASWQDAMFAAESGADSAMAALNGGGWTGWEAAGGATVSGRPAVGATYYCRSTLLEPDSADGSRLVTLLEIDAPSGLSDSGGQWYRIRATGISKVALDSLGYEPPLYTVAGTKLPASNLLRKFSFKQDKSGGLLPLPHVARKIEIIARPGTPSPYFGAITLNKQLTMGGATLIDGFDSSAPAYSTNGLYDPSKRKSNGTVNIIDTRGLTTLRDSWVYGNLAYNGPVPTGTSKVQGTISAPSTVTTTPVPKPVWPSYHVASGSIKGHSTLVSGANGETLRYKLATLDLGSSSTLTIKNPTPGKESHVEIWVTGDFKSGGSSAVIHEPGVHVTYYIEGNIDITGSSFQNKSGLAANNLVYGVTPSSGSRTLSVSGSGGFIGVINAPAYDWSVTGSGDFFGALIGNTMALGGGGAVHYDEALRGVSGPTGGAETYTVASWVEDTR